jgi:hypothetical protein
MVPIEPIIIAFGSLEKNGDKIFSPICKHKIEKLIE